jgi:regulator of replication initiation timing
MLNAKKNPFDLKKPFDSLMDEVNRLSLEIECSRRELGQNEPEDHFLVNQTLLQDFKKEISRAKYQSKAKALKVSRKRGIEVGIF